MKMKRPVNGPLNIGVVGATGLVGELFLQLMTERRFPLKTLKLFASDRSVGQTRSAGDITAPVESLSLTAFEDLDIVFFSSGDEISKEWAPLAAKAGAVAIDNSAAFRMADDVPLIVPEVNGDQLPKRGTGAIIANPNCSTIQLVCALNPLLRDYGLESVHVATYQAVSGAGRAAQEEFKVQATAWTQGAQEPAPKVFPHTIFSSCIPQIGGFGSDGFCSEEIKIMRETKKILSTPQLRVSAFTVRVPVWNAHSEAVWVHLKRTANRDAILKSLQSQPGLVIEDTPPNSMYPTAQNFSGQNTVGVGRVHQDIDNPNTWILWIVADNLRKGAALNGLQIAEQIFDITPASC